MRTLFPGVLAGVLVLVTLSGSSTCDPSGETGEGVYSPISIDPVVEILDAHFLSDAYWVIFDRAYDVEGFRHNMALLEDGTSRADMFDALIGSPEFQGQAELHSNESYVRRVYRTLLGREPSDEEVANASSQLKSYDGSGSGLTWYEFLVSVTGSVEYKDVNCHDSYYTYGRPLQEGAPTLDDLFAGRARFQDLAEAETVALSFDGGSGVTHLWDQKLPLFHDDASGKYYTFTRGYLPDGTFNIFLLESVDGRNFAQVGTDPVFVKDSSTHYYDAHLAIDSSVCPRQYVMTLECYFPGLESASLCTSRSDMPTRPETWSRPQVAVIGCNNNPGDGGCASERYLSASTGVALVDGFDRFFSWTVVDDGTVWFENADHQLNPDEGDERTYSSGIAVRNFNSFVGYTFRTGEELLRSEPDVYCTSSWDCNNRDVQDWKREQDYYYAIYNGANYYRCARPEGGNNLWALSIARRPVSGSPVGPYSETLAPLITAERDDVCGISYPVINEVGGALYLYYAYYPASGGNVMKRSRLLPSAVSSP